MSTADLNELKRFMKSSGFPFTDEWLKQCLTWIKSTYPAKKCTKEFLKNQVYEQWIDVDLNEMKSALIQPNLVQIKCVTLNEKYALQINSVRDIGESSYSQYNKLKKLENENANVEARDSTEYKPTWEPKPKRCLYLTLTDGQQTIYGMEIVPIQALDLFMKPGVKILISGPVECRRGILQLKTNNVKVLGGEVESFQVTNSVENVLARILDYPENENANNNNITETQRMMSQTQNDTQNTFNNFNATTQRITQPTSSINERPTQILPTSSNDDFFDDDEDDLLMNIDEDEIIRQAEF